MGVVRLLVEPRVPLNDARGCVKHELLMLSNPERRLVEIVDPYERHSFRMTPPISADERQLSAGRTAAG